MASSPDYEERIREFEKRYALNPGSLVFAQLADLYRKSGEPDRALEILEEGLAEHPDYLSAHIVRGRSYRDMGDSVAAVEAFSRVLELDGENLVALRSLGELARERGDPAEAKRWYERLLQVDPLNEEVEEILDGMSSGGVPDAPATAGEEVGPDAAGGPQTGERAGSGAASGGDPSLQAGATFDLGAGSAPGEPVEAEEHVEPEEPEDPVEEEHPGDTASLDQPLAADAEEPFRPDPEAAQGGPFPGGIGEEPEPESREPREPEETVESSSGGSADEAVNRAFDAVESWRRETAEAEAADEERADESGAEQDRPPGTGAPEEDEEALAAAWEEAYPEEPSTPAEADDMGFAPEAEDVEEESPTGAADEAEGREESAVPGKSDDPAFTPESDDVEEEPAAGVPMDEAAPGEPAAGVPLDEAAAGEEPAFGAPAERDPEQSDDEVFTETLAGLYARQGFYTEAVEIYEELIRRRPDDETLRERMEAARESRDRTGERLTTDAPSEIPEEEPARRGDEASATPIESAGEVPEDRGSIGEHLRALLRGEAPVGFSAGAPAEEDV